MNSDWTRPLTSDFDLLQKKLRFNLNVIDLKLNLMIFLKLTITLVNFYKKT